MAKKGQKFKKYDIDFINKVIDYRKISSYLETSRKFNISKGTIKTWMYKYKHRDGIIITKQGRPSEKKIDYKERYEILKKLHDFYKSQINKK